MIYFIKATNGFVKIGYTAKPIEIRLRALQASSPFEDDLTLLGVMPGNRETEKKLHWKFKDARSHGEWFERTSEVLAFIAENCTDKETAMSESVPDRMLTAEAESKLVEIGGLIQVARKLRSMSASTFASRVGVDRRVIADLENGKASVGMGTFFQALSILNLLRGIEELVRPENDIEAIAVNVYKTRRKMNKSKISDEKVNF